MRLSPIVFNTAFLLVLATACALTFWFVVHSRETAFYNQQAAIYELKGSRAPQFAVHTLDGDTYDPTRLRKPLVLEIFATWCDICQRQVPILNRVAKDRIADVLAVTGDRRGMFDRAESVTDLLSFKRTFAARYRLAFDRERSIAQSYKITGFPTIFIIRTNGTIAYATAGDTSYAELVAHFPR